MDTCFKFMDFLVRHWAPYPRRHPSPYPVVSFDFIRGKEDWVRRTFQSCTFSLILRGGGEFHRAGVCWPVNAPCVITQWPKEYLEYGPTAPHRTWDELYIMFPASAQARFKQCKLIDPRQPVWRIADLPAVNAQIAELQLLTHSSTPESVADRVDRICERLILETWLTPASGTESEQAIQALLAEIRRDLSQPADLEELAGQHGMSVSTFRRRWSAFIPTPPGRYLQELRIREACRLLAETSRPINDIAHAVGFEDELYFSRRFRQETGSAPRDYRRAYRIRV